MYARVDELGRTCVLSQGDIEAAQKSISKAIDVASDKSHQRGKYNSYSPEQLILHRDSQIPVYKESAGLLAVGQKSTDDCYL